MAWTGVGQAVTIFSDTGSSASDIQSTVDEFRDALGDLNPFEPQNFDGGRRQIDWDAVPDAFADPNPFPGDFFNRDFSPVARGIKFLPTGVTNGFQLSSTIASGQPVLFGQPEDFGFFSPERLFRTVDGDSLDVLFFDPSNQTTPATTRGLGVVFTGEGSGASSMVAYDRAGAVLSKENAPSTGAGGLSFLGLLFDDPDIARVSIALGGTTVMDDFIFGEPSPVPLPAGLSLMGLALGAFAMLRRRKA